ncbi:BstXI family restriction endonuclease [Vibrio cyclitrophicus]|uniref:BstXI family restriction endonuclease n=1 Tax=Vibrio cyclitrophicus TaxID=47951 RepID=UPI00148E6DB6|nr:BstXI family restriction endonuclease [Vibrio cyclitrophicus]NOH20090.1 BstXI family restriction endonuclease [Vibrio cyclitrophicus]
MAKAKRPPKLPQLLDRKIYKTGQTRGADDDVIYQNRVGRNSSVLIPFSLWDEVSMPPEKDDNFEKGFICLLTPEEFFTSPDINERLAELGLELGNNCLVFYQKRTDWISYPPLANWTPANARQAPLLGQYVARIAATTAIENGGKISEGFNTTGMKGAGIRLFEYASLETINECRIQLEAIFWMCHDSMESVTMFGMSEEDAKSRRTHCLSLAHEKGLLDFDQLESVRMTNSEKTTICPLCLEPLSGMGFFSRLAQAQGREVHDLTVTEINLFHIKELRYGEFNHRPYNLGWGHHHCNVVVKDSGIEETIDWMQSVIDRNIQSGFRKK